MDPSARLGCLHQTALSAERLAWDHRHGAAGPRKIWCDTRVWIQWGHRTLAKEKPPKSPKVQDSSYSNLQFEDFGSKTLQLFWVQFLHTMLSPRWFLSPHETLLQWSCQVRRQKACAREGSRRLATGTRIVAADISVKNNNCFIVIIMISDKLCLNLFLANSKHLIGKKAELGKKTRKQKWNGNCRSVIAHSGIVWVIIRYSKKWMITGTLRL